MSFGLQVSFLRMKPSNELGNAISCADIQASCGALFEGWSGLHTHCYHLEALELAALTIFNCPYPPILDLDR